MTKNQTKVLEFMLEKHKEGKETFTYHDFVNDLGMNDSGIYAILNSLEKKEEIGITYRKGKGRKLIKNYFLKDYQPEIINSKNSTESVLSYLKEDEEIARSIRDIAKNIKISVQAVYPIVKRLLNEDKIERLKGYVPDRHTPADFYRIKQENSEVYFEL